MAAITLSQEVSMAIEEETTTATAKLPPGVSDTHLDDATIPEPFDAPAEDAPQADSHEGDPHRVVDGQTALAKAAETAVNTGAKNDDPDPDDDEDEHENDDAREPAEPAEYDEDEGGPWIDLTALNLWRSQACTQMEETMVNLSERALKTLTEAVEAGNYRAAMTVLSYLKETRRGSANPNLVARQLDRRRARRMAEFHDVLPPSRTTGGFPTPDASPAPAALTATGALPAPGTPIDAGAATAPPGAPAAPASVSPTPSASFMASKSLPSVPSAAAPDPPSAAPARPKARAAEKIDWRAELRRVQMFLNQDKCAAASATS